MGPQNENIYTMSWLQFQILLPACTFKNLFRSPLLPAFSFPHFSIFIKRHNVVLLKVNKYFRKPDILGYFYKNKLYYGKAHQEFKIAIEILISIMLELILRRGSC